jgi:TonB family protein
VIPEPTPQPPTPRPPEPPQPIIPKEPEPEPAPQIVEEAPKPEPKTEPEPPQVAANQTPAPGEFQQGRRIARIGRIQEIPVPEPQKKPEEPKLILEDPRARMESEKGPIELAKLGIGSRPDQLVENAVQSMQERGGGPQAVGDGVGAASAGGYVPPSPGNIGSGLELLSDPKGVDFRPYLLQLLNAVRRNWYAVIPESARLGMERGRVALQFAVIRDGGVAKVVIASTSGSQPLDRAAVAGVSASTPFPPLPREFSGDEIRLQFVFLYNIKR